MGKIDVILFLKASPGRWFTIRELEANLDINLRNIRKHVVALEAEDFIHGRLRVVSFVNRPREFKIKL